MYFAVVYDNTNFYIYYGTAAAAPALIGQSVSSPPSRAYTITTSGTLAIGNRRTSTTYNTRGIDGWINDFRFYGGIGNAAFVQSVWASALGNPPIVSGIYPDGLMRQESTNTLSFTVSSPVGNDITNVSVVLNGVNVSSQLSYVTNGTSGTSSNLSVSYSNLQLNQTNAAVITARDAAGLIGGGAGTFDTFSATNFTWEAEEFDHDSGLFINNPDYTTYATNTGYFGLDSAAGVDTFKVATANSSALDYRAGSNDGTKTQTAPATGEQLRQKFLNNLADGAAVDHAVGFWSSS